MTTAQIDSCVGGWRFSSTTRLPLLLLCLIPLASPSLGLAQREAQFEQVGILIDAGFEIREPQFDQMVFGSQHSDRGQKHIESQLALKIEAIDQACALTEDQTAKLRLAGLGDIKRFNIEVALARAKFSNARRAGNIGHNVLQVIQPLHGKAAAGVFDQESYFQKVLNATLSDEQSAKYEESERQRLQFRHRARLGLVVAMMERAMPLRAAQRERFMEVFQEEAKPIKSTGELDYYVALYQLSKVPDQKLKPIFDEPQWKVLQYFKTHGLALERVLQEQKVLP